MEKVKLISGGVHQDERGSLHFNNDVLISQVKRFYQIIPESKEIIRAWQGHKVEQKWFYAPKGKFEISTVKVHSFEQADHKAPVVKYTIDSNRTDVLIVPGGYATGIRSLKDNAILTVFSNKTLEDSKKDDYRWDQNYFINSDF